MAGLLGELGVAVASGLILKYLDKGDKDQTKVEINNTLENYITQVNKNLFDVTNESVVNISNTFISHAEASAKTNNGIGNYVKIRNVKASYSNINLDEQGTLAAKMNAILQVLSDNSTNLQMTEQIVQDITTKIQQDSKLEADLKAVNSIEKTKINEGEFNSFLDKTASLLKSGDDNTSITNKIKQSLETIQDTEITLKELVERNFNNTVDNNTLTQCITTTSIFNDVDLGTLELDHTNFYSAQKGIVDIAQSCYLQNLFKNEDLICLATDHKTDAEEEIKQTSDAKGTMDVTNTIKILEKSTSIISAMLQTIIYVIAAIAIIGFIILVGVPGTDALKKPISSLFSKMKKIPPAVKEGANPNLASEVAKHAMKYFIGH